MPWTCIPSSTKQRRAQSGRSFCSHRTFTVAVLPSWGRYVVFCPINFLDHLQHFSCSNQDTVVILETTQQSSYCTEQYGVSQSDVISFFKTVQIQFIHLIQLCYFSIWLWSCDVFFCFSSNVLCSFQVR